MKIIVGLGNPGQEYINTRHNTGRIAVSRFVKDFDFPSLEISKKNKGLVTLGKVGKEKVTILFPETFMNKSGGSVATLVTSAKKARDLVVVYDDLDLPIGTFKISFNRGSGGHRGLESIIKALKTREFARIRIGISPQTPSGKLKKPKGDKGVADHIIKDFKPKEMEIIKKVSKKVSSALETIVTAGLDMGMNRHNN